MHLAGGEVPRPASASGVNLVEVRFGDHRKKNGPLRHFPQRPRTHEQDPGLHQRVEYAGQSLVRTKTAEQILAKADRKNNFKLGTLAALRRTTPGERDVHAEHDWISKSTQLPGGRMGRATARVGTGAVQASGVVELLGAWRAGCPTCLMSPPNSCTSVWPTDVPSLLHITKNFEHRGISMGRRNGLADVSDVRRPGKDLGACGRSRVRQALVCRLSGCKRGSWRLSSPGLPTATILPTGGSWPSIQCFGS